MIRIVPAAGLLLLLIGCPSAETSGTDAGPAPTDASVASDAGEQGDAGSGDDTGTPQPECAGHEVCGPTQRCHSGRCIPRVEAEPGVLFERFHVGVIDDHQSGMPPPRGFGFEYSSVIGNLGFGGTLFDIDGDGDLEIFVATQGHGRPGVSPACIYENRSSPSAPDFVMMPEHCGDRPEMPHSGFGLDLEGDGYHELLVTGLTLMELHRFHPQRAVIDLHALVPTEDGRSNCNPGSAVSLDFNWDGLVDIMLGCQHGPVSEPLNATFHLVFLQTEDGGFRLLEREEWDRERAVLLHAESLTLALGATDVNNDGLIDLVVCEDVQRERHRDPGGIYLACSPDENCRYRTYRFGPFGREPGSYMGAGMLELDGLGAHMYVSDIGPNRLLELVSRPQVDRAEDSRTELGYIGSDFLISWGVIVDDFDRDGLDDLFVSQGSLLGMDSRIYDAHFDAVLLQREGARFDLHSADLGIAPFSFDDAGHRRTVYASRAVLKADLDNDGYLDLVEFGLEGRPRLHREVPILNDAEPRCTLIPSDRYVPAHGIGHDLIPPDGGAPRHWDLQGQMRAGTSGFVVSPWRSGHLRFPSGAKVAFDCGGQRGPIRLEEPAWIDFSRLGNRLEVRLGEVAPSGALAVWVEPGAVLVESQPGDGGAVVELPEGTQRILLKIGERWVPRYFSP